MGGDHFSLAAEGTEGLTRSPLAARRPQWKGGARGPNVGWVALDEGVDQPAAVALWLGRVEWRRYWL